MCSSFQGANIFYHLLHNCKLLSKIKVGFFSLFENCVNLGERCATIFKSLNDFQTDCIYSYLLC